MPDRRIVWEVKLEINGPVKVDKHIELLQEKGFDLDQFYSNIIIRNSNNGFTAYVTAYAHDANLAYKAAFIYFGKMVDVLSFNINLPLEQFINTNRENHSDLYDTKRILKRYDFEKAFNEARQIEEQKDNNFLKALSWFRKARISQDAIDQFIAYWNVIEILGKAYHKETERTKIGVVNMVYQCFLDYFGDEHDWPVEDRWINKMYDIRSKIVHGGATIDLHNIERISKQLDMLKETSYLLLENIKEDYFNLTKTVDYDEF